MLQKNCRKTNEADVPLLSSQIPQPAITSQSSQVAARPKKTESPVAVVSDKAQMDVTPKEPQVAVIPKESPVAVVSDKAQMDVTPNQQQDSGIPAEVQKYFEELCNANGSQKVTFVNGLVGLPTPLLKAARKQYLDSQLAPPPPVNPWTARAAMLQKNCRKTNEADVPLLSSQIPQPAITSQSSRVAARPKKTESPVAVVSDKAQMDVTPKEPQVAVIPKESLVAVVSDKPQMDVTPNQQQDSGIPAEVQKNFEELCNANGSQKVTFVNGLVGLPTPLLKAARKQYLDSQLAPPPPVNPWTARAAMLQKNCRKTNEADVPLLSSQIPQPAITSQSSQVAARPKKTESPVAVVSDKPQMDVTPNQQQDSGIPAEVQKNFEELCNANGSQKVTFVNGLVGLPTPLLKAARKQYLDSQLAPPPPVNPWTARAAMLQKNCRKTNEADVPLLSSQIPQPAITSQSSQVAARPKKTESPVAVVSDKAQMDVTPKEPQVAVIPKESLVAVVSDKPQMDVTPNQQQDSGIPAEVQKNFEELCNANGSQKVTFVNGLVGLPTPLLKAARKQYLDSQLAPPPPVNPWTARAAMLQKNCRKTNEADVPLLSSQIPQPAITSQSSQVAARPKKTVVPKKVHKQPQPPKENPWLKSTKTKETIHSLEIDEIDFPLLTAEKCVVAPEKTQQAAKALNIKKISGTEHRWPHTGHYRLCTLWRTGSQLAVIPEEPELDVIVDDISTHVPQPSNTPQQAPISEATNPAEAFFQKTGVKMIAVPEIDFMEDKSEEIIKLEREQAAMLKEVEQLREMLQTQRALQAQEESKYQTRVEYLQLEISNTETSEKEVLCKVSKLEEAVEKEKSHQSETETSMSHLRAENSRLVAALTQAEEDTKKETIQWEEEKSNLLSNIKEEQQILQDEMNRTTLTNSAAKQSEESSRLVAALVQAEEEFKQETLQWEEEKSNLLQTISAQQQALENNITSNQLKDTLKNQSKEDQKDMKQWEEGEEKCSLLTSVTEQQEVHKDETILLNDSTVSQNEDNSKLVAALVQAEEGLKQEALQWEEQKANLLKSITEQQQAVEQGTSKAENQDRHNGLEEQVAAILNRPRKPSLWKRFKRLFKRTVQPPVPPPSSQPS
ncbi:hypothetical protein D5F01_LYC09070 [Larimichthys crocea]|uniref:Uncharacterized protein n=1 Tax=Larimichthys crocea TaxID=215358 RepID=A0A6G0IKC4_LARCR|nr:hypothetical protein D5F01_LYC09070 [Larimichthys crocea]